MFYKFSLVIIFFILLSGMCHAQLWKITMEFGHDNPSAIDHFKVYCKTVQQTWDQARSWDVPNTMASPDDKIEFTTPKVLPAYTFYCCGVTGVAPNGYETGLYADPRPYSPNDAIECLWTDTDSMNFQE